MAPPSDETLRSPARFSPPNFRSFRALRSFGTAFRTARSSPSGRASLLALFSLAALSPGCDVTPENIQRWKETEKGPGKLQDALKNDSLSPDLRSQALTALVEIGMLSDAEKDLKEVPESRRREVVHAAVKPLLAMAEGGGKASPADGPRRLQREGKDALFAFRDAATPEDRARMDDALIAWITVDLTGRMTAGAHASDQILAAVGARAGGKLAAVIADPATSEPNRTEAARQLGKIGDKPAREQAGAQLVERAKKAKKLEESLLQQLGFVGGDHAVAWLTAVAEDGKESPALRAKSLFALAQAADPATLPAALRLAGDGKQPGEVRDAAFELAEKLGPPAVPGLSHLLDDKKDLVRWRAVEAMMSAGKTQAVAVVLEGLPPGKSYGKEDLHDYVVRQISPLGVAALPALRDELKSKNWVARLVAAEAIAEIGKPEDADRLEALGGDDTHLKGWPGGATVGSEAKLLAAGLRAKK